MSIDLVGPLPPSEGFRYCLTCVDRFSKWPEAFPLVDISATAIATAFYSGWISRFGPPLRLTTDQGTQFESALFQALTKFLGTARQRTTSYHPAANGQVKLFHRQLKASWYMERFNGLQQYRLSSWDSKPHGRRTWRRQLQRWCMELPFDYLGNF
ncbi:hypothetical protein AVEN_91488-1 [Araneus ventricosus]|uniref:Integrase catalytic domain-containing protein n=1 Tax=Araneus ventricosus TaxID=182803 RepID=A0A4Y2BK53_ARAVE|nr:hypothetical protein AVEN_91488-1 [Araneus ventricosus]